MPSKLATSVICSSWEAIDGKDRLVPPSGVWMAARGVKTPAVDGAAGSEGATDDICEPDRSKACWAVRRGGALLRGVGVEKDILGA